MLSCMYIPRTEFASQLFLPRAHAGALGPKDNDQLILAENVYYFLCKQMGGCSKTNDYSACN